MFLNLFPKAEKLFVNPQDGLEGVIYLAESYQIPVDREMFIKLGISEGLTEVVIESILAKHPKMAMGLDLKPMCEWYLEKIVFVFVLHFKKVTEEHYKLFVNLVHGLSLDILFFEKTIRASKKLAKVGA